MSKSIDGLAMVVDAVYSFVYSGTRRYLLLWKYDDEHIAGVEYDSGKYKNFKISNIKGKLQFLPTLCSTELDTSYSHYFKQNDLYYHFNSIDEPLDTIKIVSRSYFGKAPLIQINYKNDYITFSQEDNINVSEYILNFYRRNGLI